MISIPVISKKWHTPIFGKVPKYIKIITSQIISIVLDYEKVKNKHFSIEVKFCTVEEMKNYNKEFNNSNYACDTISLLYNHYKEFSNIQKPTLLGVIFFCPSIIKQDLEVYNEKFKDNKDYLHHYIHLLIHSTLHVLGYDHKKKIDQQSMESKEIMILSKLNIKNPYYKL